MSFVAQAWEGYLAGIDDQLIARNEANILIRNSKSDFIQNNLELHRNDANKLLEKSKCYSTPNNSTINSISNFTDFMYNSINEKQISILVFIDFSKAFALLKTFYRHSKWYKFLNS